MHWASLRWLLVGSLFATPVGVCLLPLLLGIAVGSRMFVKVDKDSFRKHVLILLCILSLAGLIRALAP